MKSRVQPRVQKIVILAEGSFGVLESKTAAVLVRYLTKNIVAVTGTNGKSSVAFGLSSLLEALGDTCAVMGTLGFGHPDELENWE